MTRLSHAARVAVCVVLACLARPAAARAQDISCDPGDREVIGLAFKGNRAFSGADLSLRITTTQSGWFRRHFGFFGVRHCLDSSELPRDVLRLKLFYKDKGYFSATVDTVVDNVREDAVKVTFVITEGPPIVLDSLAITGLDSVRHRDLVLAGLGLRKGQPFDVSLFRADIDSIIARLRNAGYPKADVVSSYDVNTDSLRAHVLLQALPGPLVRISQVRVDVTPLEGRGQQISDDVVRGLIGIHPGDYYSDDQIVAAQRSLYQIGTYRHVEVAPLPDSLQPRGDSTHEVLDVALREDYMRQLDTKYGWATLDCFRTSAQYTDKNFLHQGRRLELAGQLSKIGYGYPLASSATRGLCYRDVLRRDPFSDTTNYSISATLRQPGLFGAQWVRTYSLYRERRSEYQAYLRSTLIGGEASAGKDVGGSGTLRLAYNLEYGRTEAQPALLCAVFNRCDQESQDQISRVAEPLAVVSGQYSLVRTDNAFNPSRGVALRTELRSSTRLIGSASDLTFNKATVDATFYVPVTRRSIFATRLRGGIVLGGNFAVNGPAQYIPPQERLYAGGAGSVRGFQQNELGSLLYIAEGYETIVVDDSTRYFRSPDRVTPYRVVPVGGNAMVVANFEYRVPDIFLPDLVQYTLFTDVGNVWTRGTPGTGLSWSQLKWTPGVGVRVFTPVGPVQVNVGYNPYVQPRGPIYYDATVNRETGFAPLYCVSPGNAIPVHIRSSSTPGAAVYVQDSQACPGTFLPQQSSAFLRRLTFTFSVGPEF
ncbi:MAG TPA: BamA/TamA family outer membrane protein [Gemmatimonadaceae bacterium]|nr:BamA/TamA family outer membrane protein [Gemmatimonadaceae bacterium]